MKHDRQNDGQPTVEELFDSLRDLQVPAASPEKVEAVVELAVEAFKEGRTNEGKSVH